MNAAYAMVDAQVGKFVLQGGLRAEHAATRFHLTTRDLVSNGVSVLPGLAARTFGWTARTNVTWHASHALDIQSLLFYRAPMTVEQGRTGANARFSLAAREKLMGDRMNVTLRVIDPFSMQRERSITIDPAFYQVTDQRRRDRGLILSVNWNYGKPPKIHSPDQGDQSSPPDGGPS